MLEATGRGDAGAFLRVTPPVSGRMRACIPREGTVEVDTLERHRERPPERAETWRETVGERVTDRIGTGSREVGVVALG